MAQGKKPTNDVCNYFKMTLAEQCEVSDLYKSEEKYDKFKQPSDALATVLSDIKRTV